MHVNGQLRFAGLEQLAADPVTALFEARTYWNTATKILRVYNASSSRWENSDKVQNLAANPITNLYPGRLYYNTVSRQLRIYDDTAAAFIEVSFPNITGQANKHLKTNNAGTGVEWTLQTVFENLAADPVTELYTGRVYWNTTVNEPRMRLGAVWQTFGVPDVAGNSGLYLFTDGVTAIWATAGAGSLPIQTGNAGRHLFTNGTIESWQFVQPQFNVAIVDNQAAELNITGLVYDKLTFNGIKLGFVIDRTDGATPRSTIGELFLRYDTNNDVWNIHRTEFGDFPGVTFFINSSGQVRYTSDSMGGTYVGNMQITQISTMGNL